MVTQNSDQLYIAHMKKWLNQPPVLCEIPRPLLITIIAQLQLAICHPDNPAYSKQLTEKFINQTIDAIETEDKVLASLLRRGSFHPIK
jgi:hypothetical protein